MSRPHVFAVSAWLFIVGYCSVSFAEPAPLPDLKRSDRYWYFDGVSNPQPKTGKALVTLVIIGMSEDMKIAAEWRLLVPHCLRRKGDTVGVVPPGYQGVLRWTLEFERADAAPCTLRAELKGENPDGSKDLVTWWLALRNGESGSVVERQERSYGKERYA